jgi:nitrate/nitrite transport system substrate-binding protein
MSTFDDPFDSPFRLDPSGCACGGHRSQAEHDHHARLMLQCVPVESSEKRYEGVVAAAVIKSLAIRHT